MTRYDHSKNTDSENLSPSPPRHMGCKLEVNGDELIYHRKNFGMGSLFVGGFLLIWLTGWTFGCVMIAKEAISGEPFMFLFGVPFWASWVFVAGLVLNTFFGSETMTLNREGVLWRHNIIRTFRERKYKLDELITFKEVTRNQSSSDGPDYKLRLDTTGKGFDFAGTLNSIQRNYLRKMLNAHMLKLQQQTGEAPPESQVSNSDDTSSNHISLTDAEQPSDGRWTLRNAPGEMGDALQFQRGGEFNISSFGMLLFFNLFWNGIVLVFVLQLLGVGFSNSDSGDEMVMFSGQWWGLFFFLIPFELIGLAIFIGLASQVLKAITHTTWSFEGGDLNQISRVIFIPFSKRVDVANVNRIAITRMGSRKTKTVEVEEEEEEDVNCQIALVDAHNVAITELKNLTAGEARWMAHEIAKLWRAVIVVDET